MKKQPNWVKKELVYLRKHYPDDGAEKCAKFLGRTVNSVYNKAVRLKIRTKKLSPKIIKKAIKLYNDGIIFDKITHTLNITLGQLHHILKPLKIANRNIRWTAEEDEFLINNYVKLEPIKIQKILKKSYDAITTRANKFKLKREKKLVYTVEKVDFLKENYAKLGLKKCGQHLKTNPRNLYRILKKLNLIHKNEWTKEEIEHIKKNYPSKGWKGCIDFVKRPSHSIKHMARRHGIKYNPHPVSNPNNKVCRRCLIEKSLDEFFKRKDGKHESHCKKCNQEICKTYRSKEGNRLKQKKRNTQYYKKIKKESVGINIYTQAKEENPTPYFV